MSRQDLRRNFSGCCSLCGLWLTLLLIVSSGAAYASASEARPASTSSPPPTLVLPVVLIDSLDRPELVISALECEVARLLEPARIRPRWLTPRTSSYVAFSGERPFVVKVLLSEAGPLGRTLPPGTLGTVFARPRGAHRPNDTIFVMGPAIEHELARTERTARTATEEGIAMGRVVVHELIHLVAPELGHAESGLMAAQLDRHILVTKNLSLGPRWADALRRRLARTLDELSCDRSSLGTAPAAPRPKVTAHYGARSPASNSPNQSRTISRRVRASGRVGIRAIKKRAVRGS